MVVTTAHTHTHPPLLETPSGSSSSSVMSFAGLRKQLNKANQYMSEKIGGAKGTELDDEFLEMERKTDVMGRMVDELMNKTHEFLQPNPASRAKLVAVNSLSKFRGQAKNAAYPQPEGTLGETMVKFGKDLGEDMMFGVCLVEAGESFRELAEIKYSLEDEVKQNFLEPLNQLQAKDLKEVNHHRKKLSGRRLDYDCKRRKKDKDVSTTNGSPATRQKALGSTVPDEELKVAEEKFEESKALTETAMYNLLDSDVEQIAQLEAFIEATLTYHKQAASILETLNDNIQRKREDAAGRPKSKHVPKKVTSFRRSGSPSPVDEWSFDTTHMHDDAGTNAQPYCKALYDFEPENEGELGFMEGDNIGLISRIDENWFEGTLNGQSGYFPVNYVEVVVDLE